MFITIFRFAARQAHLPNACRSSQLFYKFSIFQMIFPAFLYLLSLYVCFILQYVKKINASKKIHFLLMKENHIIFSHRKKTEGVTPCTSFIEFFKTLKQRKNSENNKERKRVFLMNDILLVESELPHLNPVISTNLPVCLRKLFQIYK